MLVVDGDLLGLLFLQRGPASFDAVGDDVGHGHQAEARIGRHGVGRGAATASAATDHADEDLVAARGVGRAGQRQSGHRYSGRAQSGNEVPP